MLSFSAHAQTDDYPTVAALREARLPARDRVDLARRFLGVTDLPAPPQNPPAREVGEEDQFWITVEGGTEQITAVLRAVGNHSYVWVDQRVPVAEADAARVTDVFDTQIYEQARALWGAEPNPGVDGDPRVYLLFAAQLRPGTGGYFTSDHLYPSQIAPYSNEHEMIVISAGALGSLVNPATFSLLGHEFQHMIGFNVDPNESTWLDEGFSMFTELYLGYDNPVGAAGSFVYRPNTQLNSWRADDNVPHYGASLMYATYLFERYGEDTLRELSAEPLDGMFAVEQVLGVEAANELFADWVLANFLDEPSPYGYRLLPALIAAPTVIDTTRALPYTYTGEVSQYAADYHAFSGVEGTLNITLEMPAEIALLPIDGDWFMWSSRGDNSDAMLTRAFDLSSVNSATLHYRVWADTEPLWDYAYVAISSDDGATWTPLETPQMTRENPHGTSYGAAYSGALGGWLDQAISLDDYAGQAVLIRFEMITDDSIPSGGMAVDDVRIPELDYSEDFEQGDGGWQSAGWIRTDNRLPQRAWVHAFQQTSSGRLIDGTVQHWRYPPDDDSVWMIDVSPDAAQVIVVIAPFAPVTTETARYTLSVGGE